MCTYFKITKIYQFLFLFILFLLFTKKKIKIKIKNRYALKRINSNIYLEDRVCKNAIAIESIGAQKFGV